MLPITVVIVLMPRAAPCFVRDVLLKRIRIYAVPFISGTAGSKTMADSVSTIRFVDVLKKLGTGKSTRLFTCSFTRGSGLCVRGVVAPAQSRRDQALFVCWQAERRWTQQAVVSRPPLVEQPLRATAVRRFSPLLCLEISCYRVLRLNLVQLYYFSPFCALFVCTVLFCEAVLRQSSILFFTTSKITCSPSCQKVGKYFCFSLTFI